MKNTRKIFFILGMLVFCINAWSVPIHDEIELIQTIKKLDTNFSLFEDVRNYIKDHCDSLEDPSKIKSAIKNQIAQIGHTTHVMATMIKTFAFFGIGLACIANIKPLENENDFSQMHVGFFGIGSWGIALRIFYKDLIVPAERLHSLSMLYDSF